jgi:hypothetical protein
LLLLQLFALINLAKRYIAALLPVVGEKDIQTDSY